MAFLTALWNGLRSALAMVLPVFGKARAFSGMAVWLRWVIHFILLAAILVGLYFLNNQGLNLPEKIPTTFRPLAHYWLPVLFLLVYVLAWLGWWLYKLIGSEDQGSDFPDIDAAWDEAMQALSKAGIGIADAPLFLVMGKPAGTEEALFLAAQLQLIVKQAPQRPEAPLHVYANRESIYVTCAGASLLGAQAGILSGQGDGGAVLSAVSEGAAVGAEEANQFKTMRIEGGRQLDIKEILNRANREGRELTEEERQQLRQLKAEDDAEHAQQMYKARPQLLKDTAQIDLLSARFRHLCRLIVRDRRPYCPINGILVLVPFAATDTEDDANQTGEICRRDLALARDVLQVHCPIFALECDLEATPGFRDFLDRFTQQDKQRRVGQRFPLMPDVNGDALPAMIDGGVQWICNSVFPNWVYKMFRLESTGKDEPAKLVKGNIALYQLMSQIRERQKRLSRILTRVVISDKGGPPLFGGCYLAGTGRDPAHEQAFVAGVFRRLVEEQNFVSWTDEALATEAECKRWTRIGYLFIGALFLAGLAAAAYLIFLSKPHR